MNPDLTHESPTTQVMLHVMENVVFITSVAEICNQLLDGLPHFESVEDYLRIEALAVQARAWRQQKEQDALKEMPLFAGLLELGE